MDLLDITRCINCVDVIIFELNEKIFEEDPVITPDTSLSEVFPDSAQPHVPKFQSDVDICVDAHIVSVGTTYASTL